jgi:phosphate transport system protein
MTTPHTSRAFEADLQDLQARALSMGVRCEQATEIAFQAYLQGQPARAPQVSQLAARLDRDQVEIEADVLRILALRQPVAIDLRFLAATLRLVTDLERIGDAAMNITECTVEGDHAAKTVVRRELEDMDRTAQGMLREALRAFVERDPDAARKVLARDGAVDRRCSEITAAMANHLRVHPEDVAAGLRVMWVAKYLERIADHATNLAEHVVYLERGDDVRHRGSQHKIPTA